MTFQEKVYTKLTGEPGLFFKEEWIPYRNIVKWEMGSDYGADNYWSDRYLTISVVFDSGSPKTFKMPGNYGNYYSFAIMDTPNKLQQLIQAIQDYKDLIK